MDRAGRLPRRDLHYSGTPTDVPPSPIHGICLRRRARAGDRRRGHRSRGGVEAQTATPPVALSTATSPSAPTTTVPVSTTATTTTTPEPGRLPHTGVDLGLEVLIAASMLAAGRLLRLRIRRGVSRTLALRPGRVAAGRRPRPQPRPRRSPRELAAALAAGDVVLVEGELGAGKTTFVRGACRRARRDGAGDQPDLHDRAALPRPVPVLHLDLYRLADLGQRGSGSARRLPAAPTRSRSSNGPRPSRGQRVAGRTDRRARPDRPPRAARAMPAATAADRSNSVRILAFDTATPATTVAARATSTAASARGPRRSGRGRAPAARHRLLALIAELLERSGTGWKARRSDRRRGRARHVHRSANRDRHRPGARAGPLDSRWSASRRSSPWPSTPPPPPTARHASAGAVLAVLDARRGEAFVAAWRLAGGPGHRGRSASSSPKPRALAPEALRRPDCGALGPCPLADRRRGGRIPGSARACGGGRFRRTIRSSTRVSHRTTAGSRR